MDHGKMALNFFQHIKGRRPFNEIHVITDRALVIAASELLRTHLVFRFEDSECDCYTCLFPEMRWAFMNAAAVNHNRGSRDVCSRRRG
jgi:hypothetical protein